ncbi:hypothetical protein SAMN05216355_11276 [Actinomyces ruminicola]|uniref:Uncharacterized protein n=1 Tax=Actinomyces ruminicola TaxID=332524 RepID=A0A1H0DY30_9ACTO|nr:hypothetical protein SAMN05216355_11276 [Actinomyces ruminicola]
MTPGPQIKSAQSRGFILGADFLSVQTHDGGEDDAARVDHYRYLHRRAGTWEREHTPNQKSQ